MRHLGTFFGFVVLGIIVVCADFYERSRSEEQVVSASDYGTDVRERLSWLIGETDAQIERANAGGARGGYSPPVPETTSEPMKAAGALAELLGGALGTPKLATETTHLGGKIRAYLPSAPDGWARRDFEMSDLEVMPGFAGALEERHGQLQYTSGKILKTALKGERNLPKLMRDRTTYMYEQGDKLVQVTALNYEKPSGGMGMDVHLDYVDMLGKDGRKFFAVSQGLVWMIQPHVHWTEKVKGGPDPVMLNARLGDVTLYIKALAPEEDMRDFIDGFDIDGLNGALIRPFPNVGSHAPELTEEAQLAAHEAELEQRRILRDKRRDDSEKEMIEGAKDFVALTKTMGINKQIRGHHEKALEAMGLPNREKLGDYSVMSREDIIAKSQTFTDAEQRTLGEFFSMTVLELGLTWEGLRIAVDGNTKDAAQSAKAYKKGTLEESAPAYALRAEEAKRKLPPGSCLQIEAGGYFCGDIAEKLRFLWIDGELREAEKARKHAAKQKKKKQKAALREAERKAREKKRQQAQAIKDNLKGNQSVARKPPSRADVAVNRLPTIRSSRKSGGCGGTQFCRAGN